MKMRNVVVFWWAVIAVPALISFTPANVPAFYQLSAEEHGLLVSGLLAAGLGPAVYPKNNFLYDTDRELIWNGDLRIIAEGYAGKNLRGEVNVLQNYRTTSAVLHRGGRFAQLDVERSSLLYRQQHTSENTQAGLVLDTGQMAYGDTLSELVVGRQPISLSVSFYFTPNDFFAPFAPQNFYRVYKPGVDAIRYERRLADLSQLSVVGVLGYDGDPESDSGWSVAPDWQRTSVAGRWVWSMGLDEWGLIAGVVRETAVIGASYQGEWWHWLGVRVEGHYVKSGQEEQESGVKLSGGLEHRFGGGLTLRLEQMYNGTGYDSIRDVNDAMGTGNLLSGYLGKHYTAINVGYEFMPLLNGEFLYLRNWTDQSRSFSLYAVYSLSDESELAFTLTIPQGEKPDTLSINSEFGLQPSLCTFEYRLYF